MCVHATPCAVIVLEGKERAWLARVGLLIGPTSPPGAIELHNIVDKYAAAYARRTWNAICIFAHRDGASVGSAFTLYTTRSSSQQRFSQQIDECSRGYGGSA